MESRQVIDLEDGIVNSVYIQELNTKYVQVSGKLTAVEGEFGTLKANVAEFEETYTKRLTAAEADIGKLRTTDLSAVNGKIEVLDSNYANIRNLLSGDAGIGDLQNIHLTSDNAVIDTALIRTAVMQSVRSSGWYNQHQQIQDHVRRWRHPDIWSNPAVERCQWSSPDAGWQGCQRGFYLCTF